MAVEPTGRRETRDFGEAVVFDRVFATGIAEVWASITETGRLENWIGVWEGDPASGSVVFRMTAEGDDAPPETVTIRECRPPHALRFRIAPGTSPAQGWEFEITLAEHDGATTLTFAQSVAGEIPISDVAPGWEYYLDRLVADRAGGDLHAIDFARDYHPAMSEHYRAMFA